MDNDFHIPRRGLRALSASLGAAALLALAGCAGPQTQIEAGRRELLYGDPSRAVVHFRQATEEAPDRLYYSRFPESSLTYLGRAYYTTGRLSEARRALESAVARSERDHLAKLYLGLVLAREGDRARGQRYVEDGLRGIHEWIDYVERSFNYSFGQYWDPNREIRRQIEADLNMIAAAKVDWPKLIADAEWVGKRVEQEIDYARRDESLDRSREGEDRGRQR